MFDAGLQFADLSSLRERNSSTGMSMPRRDSDCEPSDRVMLD